MVFKQHICPSNLYLILTTKHPKRTINNWPIQNLYLLQMLMHNLQNFIVQHSKQNKNACTQISRSSPKIPKSMSRRVAFAYQVLLIYHIYQLLIFRTQPNAHSTTIYNNTLSRENKIIIRQATQNDCVNRSSTFFKNIILERQRDAGVSKQPHRFMWFVLQTRSSLTAPKDRYLTVLLLQKVVF